MTAAVHRLAAIVADSSDAIVAKDLEGNVTSWNKAAEEIFGYSAGEIIGHSVRAIIPPDRELPGEVAGRRVLRQRPFDQAACAVMHLVHPDTQCPTRGRAHSDSGRLSVSTRDATLNPNRS